jgi:uncharacterized protein YbgA (DUF1722 family)
VLNEEISATLMSLMSMKAWRNHMPSTLRSSERDPSNIRIFVLGDVNLDTLLVPLPLPIQTSETGQMAWIKERNFWRHRRRGGAWLLAEIINAALRSSDFVAQVGRLKAETYNEKVNSVVDTSIETSLPDDYLSSTALLGLFPQTAKERHGDKKLVYRLEKFVGWLHTHASVTDQDKNNGYEDRLLQCLQNSGARGAQKCDILVLHDRAGYFRHLERDKLDEYIDRYFEEGRTWIVWQMYSPLVDGNLWEVIVSRKDKLVNRTIAVVKM